MELPLTYRSAWILAASPALSSAFLGIWWLSGFTEVVLRDTGAGAPHLTIDQRAGLQRRARRLCVATGVRGH